MWTMPEILYGRQFKMSRLLWRFRFNLRRILIVGKDQTAISVKEELSRIPELGYEIVGFVSPENELTKSIDFNFSGKIDQLIEMSNRERIQEVIFVNIDKYYENIVRPLIQCKKRLIDVRIISDDFEHEAIDPKIKDFFF